MSHTIYMIQTLVQRRLPKVRPHAVHTVHMFYIPRTQPHYDQPEYHPYGYLPRRSISSYDDDFEHERDDYVKTKRREYLEALHQYQKHCEYEHAVALENQRHRAQLTALAEREVFRNRRSSYQPHPLYGYEQAQVSTLDEPVRRRRPAPKCQPQRPFIWMTGRPDDWQDHWQNCTEFLLDAFICKMRR